MAGTATKTKSSRSKNTAKKVEAKPVEACEAPATKARSKPQAKRSATTRAASEAATAPGPSAERPTASLAFNADWSESIRGALVAGGVLTIDYAPERARAHGGHEDASNQWGLHAYVQFMPGGEIVETPVINFPLRFGKPARQPKAIEVKIDVPTSAREVQVWFRNWSDANGAHVRWDSRFGLNYRFAVRPA